MSHSRRHAGVCAACGRVQSARRRLCGGCGAGLQDGGGDAAGPRLPAPLREVLEAGPVPSRGRALLHAGLLLVMAWASWDYLRATVDRPQRALSLVHHLLESANLVFHEAGHWIFGVAGFEPLTIAGGSLLQLLIPALCALAFLSRHPDAFAACFACWWTGQAAVDLAPYVADARAQRLILLGGVTGRDRPGYHDWNNLLGRFGLLEWDTTLGWLLHLGGLLTMAAAIAAAAMVLRQQWDRASGATRPETDRAPRRSPGGAVLRAAGLRALPGRRGQRAGTAHE